MHDAVTGERLGVPSVAVITERFASAAELMAQVLGAPGYEFVEIAHPISSKSDGELAAVAAEAAAECARRLTETTEDE